MGAPACQPQSSQALETRRDRWQQRMDLLRRALRDDDPQVRAAVSRSLERLEGLADVSVLAANLQSADMVTRLNAIYGLGAIGDASALPALVQALGDPVEDIRAAAVRTLGELRAPATLDPVVGRLDDESPLVRRQAIEALGCFADRRTAPILRALLAEHEVEVLREALRALAATRDPDAEADVSRHLEHPDPGVRAAAAEALGQLD